MSAPDKLRETMREQLSALMDGELSRDESLFLLKRLEHDAELRDEWERLHLCSALQHGEFQVVSSGFSARIMACVASEETAQAGGGLKIAAQSRLATMPRWLGTVAGGAVAAAVAYVALVQLGPDAPLPPTGTGNTALAVTPAAGSAVRPGSAATGTMNLPTQLFAPAAQTSGGGTLPGLNAVNLKLDRYLLRHSEALGLPAYGAQPQPLPQLLSPGLYPVRFGDTGSRAGSQGQ